MSSTGAGANKASSVVFETVLSSPGMSEKCKIILSLSRQNILLLCRLIEAGLLSGNGTFDDEVFNVLQSESLEEFRMMHEEILKRADLSSFYEKLKLLK